MLGIVSLLDPVHTQQVESLWGELTQRYGLGSVFTPPLPHFSYHVAEAYNAPLLAPILQELAQQTTTFQVKSSGLGIFSGPQPVLYFPIVRSRELTEFHQTLWERVAHASSGEIAYYHPESWQPHITIAMGDPKQLRLAEILSDFSQRSFAWEIPVNNLTVLDAADSRPLYPVKNNFNPPGVTVGPSQVHGLGVLAQRLFEAGESVLIIDDSRTVDEGHPLRPEWGEQDHHCDYLTADRTILMQSPERHINSSCDPNTYVKTREGKRHVVARRPIPAGEEITYDYIINCHGGDVWQCNCAAANCRGTIVSSFFELPIEWQAAYLPLLDDWFIEEQGQKVDALRSQLG